MSKLKPEYRALANPIELRKFLDGKGVLAHRQQVAEHFEYDWHARKLSFESHFRGHLLMQATAYDSTRDHQWAAANDALFLANGAGVEISVSGLAQANRKRPLEPLVVLVEAVMQAVANLPARKLRALDKQTWQGIVGLLHRTELFDATTLKLPPKLTVAPSSTVWSAPASTEGGTLSTVTVSVSLVIPPSSSVTVSVTV